MNRAAFQTVFEREPDKSWSIKELADVLGVHPDTVRTAIREGRLEAQSVGGIIRLFGGHIADWLAWSMTRSDERKIVCSARIRLTTEHLSS